MQYLQFFFEAITMLGDSGLVFPASGGLFAALFASGDRRTALALAGAVGACAVITVGAKIFFMIYSMPGLHSPSGHASMATIFFSSLGLIAARSERNGAGRLGAAICALLIASVALSRVALAAHTWPETLIGVAIGLCSFGLFWSFASKRTPIGVRKLAFFVVIVVALYAAFGANLSLEEPLERIAAHLGELLRR